MMTAPKFDSLRYRLLAGTIAAGALFSVCATPALAQAASQTADQAADQVDEGDTVLTVTGSRIPQPNAVSNSPISQISAAELDFTGQVNIEAITNKLPSISPGSNSANNNPGGGLATINLRGIGTNRTLILVNGRRVVPGAQDGTVDVSQIPSQLIDRVEVVTGGASAVYGSDAIAGVVNFILDDNFEGVEATSQYLITQRGDGGTFDASGKIGINSPDGKGNVTIFAGYTRRNPVFQSARAFSAFDLFNVSGTIAEGRFDSSPANRPSQAAVNAIFGTTATGQPNVLNTSNFGINANGTLFNTSGASAANPNQTIRNYQGLESPTCVAGGTAACTFNFAPFNFLQLPQERYNIAGRAHYEIGDFEFSSVTAFAEIYYNVNQVQNVLAPSPVTNLSVSPTNPTVPAQLRALLASRVFDPTAPAGTTGPDANFTFRRRTVEAGSRVASLDNTAFQVIAGFNGKLFNDWQWDISYNYGRTFQTTTQTGNISFSRFQAAIDQCPTGAPAGCIPVNAFGLGSLTNQAAIDAFTIQNLITQDYNRTDVQGNLVGDLFELPAGKVGFAIGFEYRNDSTATVPDPLLGSPDIIGFNFTLPTVGRDNVKEGYFEVQVPVLKELPFVYALNLNAGYRYSSYASIGGVSSFKGGGDWSVNKDFRFRGLFQRAVRAPSVSELAGPRQVGFPDYVDPCASINPAGRRVTGPNAAQRALCVAQGIPASAINAGTFQQTSTQIQSFSGGSRLLQEERSNTFTAGFVWSPQSLVRNLTLSADYYVIGIRGFITAPDPQFLIDQCFSQNGAATLNPNAPECRTSFGEPLFVRDRTGQADELLSNLANVGALNTSGIDAQANYRLDFEDIGLPASWGSLNFAEAFTWVNSIRVQQIPGAAFTELVGTGGSQSLSNVSITFPKFRNNLSTGWTVGGFTSEIQWRLISGVDDVNPQADIPRVPLVNYLDLNLRYQLTKNWTFFAGINNLADKKPPVSDSVSTQANTDPARYDTLLRTFFFGVKASF